MLPSGKRPLLLTPTSFFPRKVGSVLSLPHKCVEPISSGKISKFVDDVNISVVGSVRLAELSPLHRSPTTCSISRRQWSTVVNPNIGVLVELTLNTWVYIGRVKMTTKLSNTCVNIRSCRMLKTIILPTFFV